MLHTARPESLQQPSDQNLEPMENINKIERPGTLQALAYDKIKGLMIAGELDFDSIYSANQFAEILGVSRTPVREALLQLSAEGLLTSSRRLRRGGCEFGTTGSMDQ